MVLNFVLCHRFHGATALALLLNNHSQVSSLGDMLPSSEFDQSCACGNTVSKCPFWQMMEHKFQPMRQFALRTMYPSSPQLSGNPTANNAIVKMLSLAALYTSGHIWRLGGGAAGRFIDFYIEFVDTVNEYNNTSVFINGVKSLTSVLAIKSILGDQVQVNLIHLIRDPRGFYCSENRDDPNIGIEESAKRWNTYHTRVINFVQPLCNARYLSIRYEDLCEQPAMTIEQIFDFVGVEHQNVFRPPSTNHLIGNAAKGQFDGTLRQSIKWRQTLSKAEQERCLVSSQPMSRKFGYSVDSVPFK
jgi:hypothetical protein